MLAGADHGVCQKPQAEVLDEVNEGEEDREEKAPVSPIVTLPRLQGVRRGTTIGLVGVHTQAFAYAAYMVRYRQLIEAVDLYDGHPGGWCPPPSTSD